MLVGWAVGLLGCWFPGVLVCWFVGCFTATQKEGCWVVGLLVCWYVGLLVVSRQHRKKTTRPAGKTFFLVFGGGIVFIAGPFCFLKVSRYM